MSWARLVQGPVLISLLTSSFTFVGTILLYRSLSSSEAGEFTLILALVQVGVLVGGLGQSTLIQRIYSYAAPDVYHWVRDIVVSNLMALPILGLVPFIAMQLYRLSRVHVLIISGLVLVQLTILSVSRMLNATRSYTLASFILRAPNSLLIFPAVALLILNPGVRLDFVLGFYLALATVVAVFGVGILTRLRQIGSKTITWRERISGIIFLFTQSSYILPDQGVIAISGSMLTPEELASLGAVLPFLKPFELLSDVLRNILTTELIHYRSHRLRRVIYSLWASGLALATFTIFAGPSIFDWIYSGRYTLASKLIPWLAIAGFFRVIEVFPRSAIIGQSTQMRLRRFVIWQTITAGVLLAIGLKSLMGNGGVAVAWSIAAIQIGRFFISQVQYRAGLAGSHQH